MLTNYGQGAGTSKRILVGGANTTIYTVPPGKTFTGTAYATTGALVKVNTYQVASATFNADISLVAGEVVSVTGSAMILGWEQ